MNGRIGKAKFNSLRIILDSVASSSIILGKNISTLQNKIPSLSVGVKNGVTSTLIIPVK